MVTSFAAVRKPSQSIGRGYPQTDIQVWEQVGNRWGTGGEQVGNRWGTGGEQVGSVPREEEMWPPFHAKVGERGANWRQFAHTALLPEGGQRGGRRYGHGGARASLA